MKSDFSYIPVKEDLFSRELGHYISFGIEALEHGSLCRRISDISTDEDFVAALARKCTSGQLDPIHLLDVIEDSLGT